MLVEAHMKLNLGDNVKYHSLACTGYGKIISVNVFDGEDYVVVRWDTGNIAVENRTSLVVVSQELEKDFDLVIKNVHEASILLTEAKQLATKYDFTIERVLNDRNERKLITELLHSQSDLGWSASSIECGYT
jgi:hypothetical protein